LTENRGRDRDVLIEGKRSDQACGRVWIGREALGELHPGFQLDHGNDSLEYFVEQLDLPPGMMAGAGEEQVRDARERSEQSFRWFTCCRALNLIDQ
jgi:hypothetical protein